MRSRSRFIRTALALCALHVVQPWTVSLGAEGLERLVPDDVHFFETWKPSPGAERIWKPIEEAFGRLVESGIGSDILQLAMIELDEEERSEVRRVVRALGDACEKPDWSSLFAGEGAFTFRLDAPLPHYAMLLRVAEGTATQRLAELGEMLRGFASLAPEQIRVSDEERGEAAIVRLAPVEAPVPIGLIAARHGDVIILTTSGALLSGVLGLADSDSDSAAGSVAAEPRLSTRDASGRGIFRVGAYVRFIQQFVGMGMMAAGDDPNAKAVFGFAQNLLVEAGRLDTVTWDQRIRGNRNFVDSTLSFTQSPGPGFIERLIAEPEPIDTPLRLVPRDAIGFRAGSGIKPVSLYDALIGAVETYCPVGNELLAHWAELQRTVEFDVREDLLSWMAGGGVVMQLPGPRPCPESVCLIRLSDPERASSFLERVRRNVEPYLESRGHRVDLVELADLGGLHEVRISTLPWLKPVVGIIGPTMVIASSVDAAQRCAAAFRGDAPNIGEHPDLVAAELPDGKLQEIYWYDVPPTLQAISDLAGTIGFVASLLPEDRETKPVILVGAIVAKLTAFVRELDCVGSVAGWSQYDGETHEIRGRQVMRYRDR